jgi:hypothetical protein
MSGVVVVVLMRPRSRHVKEPISASQVASPGQGGCEPNRVLGGRGRRGCPGPDVASHREPPERCGEDRVGLRMYGTQRCPTMLLTPRSASPSWSRTGADRAGIHHRAPSQTCGPWRTPGLPADVSTKRLSFPAHLWYPGARVFTILVPMPDRRGNHSGVRKVAGATDPATLPADRSTGRTYRRRRRPTSDSPDRVVDRTSRGGTRA